jgi:hypothetical protein
MIKSSSIMQAFAEAIKADPTVIELIALYGDLAITLGRVPDIESGELDNIVCPSVFIAQDGETVFDGSQEINIRLALHIKDDEATEVEGIRTLEGYGRLEDLCLATLAAIIAAQGYGREIEEFTFELNSEKFPVFRGELKVKMRLQSGLNSSPTDTI